MNILNKVEKYFNALLGCRHDRDAGLSGFQLSWPEAFDFVKQMNATGQYGLNQWRLPTRSELFSLVSHDRINPAVVQPDQFFNLFNGYYWTATPCARYPDQAWYVHLGGGRVVKGMIHRSYMVWPVHDSSSQNNEPGKNRGLPQNRFVLSEDMVVDRATGLSWLQHADILNSMSGRSEVDNTFPKAGENHCFSHQTESGYEMIWNHKINFFHAPVSVPL
ncbi:MAG: DUF1566 domain-containing protein [Desulfobacula sp.]|nr:DUF1566 domain-containing protein [Desulfobacula sp.]